MTPTVYRCPKGYFVALSAGLELSAALSQRCSPFYSSQIRALEAMFAKSAEYEGAKS